MSQVPLEIRSSFAILTPPHTLHLATQLKRQFNLVGIECVILENLDESVCDTHTYIVIAPQVFQKLPRSFIFYQVEQLNQKKWSNKKYKQLLRQAEVIFEYSVANIKILKGWGISYRNIYFMPSQPINRSCQFKMGASKKVGFYGATGSSPRRIELLDALSKRFELIVINNSFGTDLVKQLSEVDVILNLHYYENAMLETPRLAEAFDMGKKIVSEKATDMAFQEDWRDIINFAEVGDVESISIAINKSLFKVSDEIIFKKRDYLLRFLLAYDIIPFENFYEKATYCIDSNKICLYLPEFIERVESNLSTRNEAFGFEFFPGLRHRLPWKGCALSYRFLARRLLTDSNEFGIIAEEDAIIPAELDLDELAGMIDQQASHAQVISGFMADVHEDTIFSKISEFKGRHLIECNKMVSTVFNVYSKEALAIMALWQSDSKLTIDRFMQSHDMIVKLIYPYLVGHSEDANSTIWGFNNKQYNYMIEKSYRTIDKKIEDHRLQ